MNDMEIGKIRDMATNLSEAIGDQPHQLENLLQLSQTMAAIALAEQLKRVADHLEKK